MGYLRQESEVEKDQSEVERKECGRRRERRDKRGQLHFKAGYSLHLPSEALLPYYHGLTYETLFKIVFLFLFLCLVNVCGMCV